MPPSGSLLALDLSRRRIGVAGTDPGRSLVTALETIPRTSFKADVAKLQGLCKKRDVVALVVGLPLDMDGSEGPAAQSVRSSANAISRALDLPVLLQDERLTTEAVRAAIEDGRLAKPKSGAALDHYAAAVILEDVLRAEDRQSWR